MFCKISGQIPKEPTVDKNGNLYEKSLILKFMTSLVEIPSKMDPNSASWWNNSWLALKLVSDNSIMDH